MTTATRWALVVGALALALLVALLPRTGDDAATPPGQAKAGEELGPARDEAALRPCPKAGDGEVGELAGVEVSCLADGAPVDLGSALAGEPTLVNVWATWCEPCRSELPLLDTYARGEDAVRVLTVQVQSKQHDGLALLAELGVRLPGVFDGDGASGPVREALSVPRVLPASYLVTADGSVRFVGEPRVFHSVADIRRAVAELGAEKGAP